MIGLPLWVKHRQRSYSYYILSPPCKRDSSFEILLEGQTCKIYLDGEENWVESSETGDLIFEKELMQIIGNTVLGHFHIKKSHYH
jgi:hypothetical protein